jgi:hypothetical protein
MVEEKFFYTTFVEMNSEGLIEPKLSRVSVIDDINK